MPLFGRRGRDGSDDRWVVVGLGNPGEDYARTRHNAGVMVLAILLERVGARLKSHKSGCLIAEASLAGERAILARSTSYMNESGGPVGRLMRFFKAGPDRLIVVHDELDLPFGEVRVKFGGGTAGHNGLKSVGNHLGSKDFARVRIGVSRPRGYQDPTDHVLSEFSSAERKELPFILERAADAVESIIEHGIERAMNTYNTRA